MSEYAEMYQEPTEEESYRHNELVSTFVVGALILVIIAAILVA